MCTYVYPLRPVERFVHGNISLNVIILGLQPRLGDRQHTIRAISPQNEAAVKKKGVRARPASSGRCRDCLFSPTCYPSQVLEGLLTMIQSIRGINSSVCTYSFADERGSGGGGGAVRRPKPHCLRTACCTRTAQGSRLD